MAVFNEQLPKFPKRYQLALASRPHTPRRSGLTIASVWQGQENELSSQASGARGQQGVPAHLRAPWGPPLPVRSSSCGPPAHLPVAHLPGLAVPHLSRDTTP